LASVYLFKDTLLQNDPAQIQESIQRSEIVLMSRGLIKPEVTNDNRPYLLLKNLVDIIPTCLEVLNWHYDDAYICLPEQHLIDYQLHMRGVPDLVIENKERRKAIVVEWKTTPETPSKHEEAQAIAYSLLEASRLGYRNSDILNSILGRFDENNMTFTDIHILPIIIRPSTRRDVIIKPHPIFSGLTGEHLKEEYEKFRRLIYNVLIEAEHLTILSTNVEGITRDRLDTIRSRCIAKTRDGHEVFSLRYTPHQLPRGNPRRQGTFPCIACPSHMKEACRFYFGSKLGEASDFDRTIWEIRFRVYEMLEKILIIYKALYTIFENLGKDNALEGLKNGYEITWDVLSEIPNYSYKRLCRIVITRQGKELTRNRYDILEHFESTLLHNTASLSIPDVILKRRLRDYEEKAVRTLNEGKSALLIFLDSENPLLSPNLFCRIDEVRISESEEEVLYVLSIPSLVFRFSFLLTMELIKNRQIKLNSEILLIEADANLTHLELKAVDTLQRRFQDQGIEQPAIMSMLNDVKEEYTDIYERDETSLNILLARMIAHGGPKFKRTNDPLSR
jgi:hypothetical protein